MTRTCGWATLLFGACLSRSARGLIALACLGLGAAAADPARNRLVDFQQYRFGLAPAEFDYDASGPHGPVLSAGRPLWRTYVDLLAPSPKMVLIQSSTLAQADHYPIALLRDWTAENLKLAVSLKMLSGHLTRSAGLLWRVQDKDHYYAVLVGGSDLQVRFFQMNRGQPVELAKAPAPLAKRQWNDLEVCAQYSRVDVWLNDRLVLLADLGDQDPAKPGRVGLITQADTMALFDDFYVQSGAGRVVRKPHPPPEQSTAPNMRVLDLFTTWPDFKTPRLTFQPGERICWQACVTDQNRKPVPAAVVLCEFTAPTGEILGLDKGMTGSDGTSLFSRLLPANAAPGFYTIHIRAVTHADLPEATYDAGASPKPMTKFEVRK
jgi:hypothetical protein